MKHLEQITERAMMFRNDINMTSREIAELTNKRHPDVSRDIRTMCNELKIDVSTIGRIYLDSMNRQQTEYVLDWELTFTLITGYSIKLRNAVIKRWGQLEQAVPTLTRQLEYWQLKEVDDKMLGTIHGTGLAHRKTTKRVNNEAIIETLNKMQLTLNYGGEQ